VDDVRRLARNIAALAQRGGSGQRVAVALRGDVVVLCQFARLSRLWADIGLFSPHHIPDPAGGFWEDYRYNWFSGS
jgi:hypothetical protein